MTIFPQATWCGISAERDPITHTMQMYFMKNTMFYRTTHHKDPLSWDPWDTQQRDLHLAIQVQSWLVDDDDDDDEDNNHSLWELAFKVTIYTNTNRSKVSCNVSLQQSMIFRPNKEQSSPKQNHDEILRAALLIAVKSCHQCGNASS